MKFNGKIRKYEYKDITTLGLYLLDYTDNENPYIAITDEE